MYKRIWLVHDELQYPNVPVSYTTRDEGFIWVLPLGSVRSEGLPPRVVRQDLRPTLFTLSRELVYNVVEPQNVCNNFKVLSHS